MHHGMRAASSQEKIRVPRSASHEAILAGIREYLLEGFSTVTIAHEAEARTGSALIHALNGRKRWSIEITDTFLDPDANRPEPVAALRRWDLIGVLLKAEPGSIMRVTTAGLRLV
jgi:hypothetical protein